MKDKNTNGRNLDNKNFLWIGIVILLVAVAVYFVAYYYRSEKIYNHSEATTPNSIMLPATNNNEMPTNH